MKAQNNLKGSMILITAALVWGFSLVVQGDAAERISPFLLTSLRSVLGSLFLILLLFVRKALQKKEVLPTDKKARRSLLLTGAACGALLTLALGLQQLGLGLYPVGVAAEARCGFLMTLYVIIVPLLTWIFGERLSPSVLFAIALAIAGIYFLCLSEGLEGIYWSDVLMLLCAIFFSFQILIISRFGSTFDGIQLSVVQLGICAILSGIASLCFETISWEMIQTTVPNILYLGLLSSGVAYTLQIIGQRYTDPTVASLALSMESVFATICGWIFLGHGLSGREMLGCALLLLAMLLVQILPTLAEKQKNKTPTDPN